MEGICKVTRAIILCFLIFFPELENICKKYYLSISLPDPPLSFAASILKSKRNPAKILTPTATMKPLCHPLLLSPLPFVTPSLSIPLVTPPPNHTFPFSTLLSNPSNLHAPLPSATPMSPLPAGYIATVPMPV